MSIDESMMSLEKDYIELSNNFVKSQEKNKELFEKLRAEQEKNLEVMNRNIEITKNADEISQDYIQMSAELAKIKEYTTHGARIDLEDGHIFIPFMEKNLIGMKNIKNRPTKIRYTFNPQEILEWISSLEEALEDNKPPNFKAIIDEINS